MPKWTKNDESCLDIVLVGDLNKNRDQKQDFHDVAIPTVRCFPLSDFQTFGMEVKLHKQTKKSLWILREFYDAWINDTSEQDQRT